MTYWDELVATYGGFFTSYTFLLFIGVVVLVAGLGSIIFGAVMWLAGDFKGWVSSLIVAGGIAILLFGVPFVNWLGKAWGL